MPDIKLIPVNAEYLDFIHNIRNNPLVNKYISRDVSDSPEKTLDFIKGLENKMNKEESYFWVINDETKDHPVGTICLWNLDKVNKTAEIGYELHPDFWKQSYMSSALKKLIQLARSKYGFKKLLAYTHYQNDSSIALLNKFSFSLNPDIKDPDFPYNQVFELEI